MGNPNSLGAVMGVVGAPILLWGTTARRKNHWFDNRRLALLTICVYLIFYSHARAAMVAAVLSRVDCLCLALRKYKMLGQGVVTLLILVAATRLLRPQAFSNMVSNLTFFGRVQGTGSDPGPARFAGVTMASCGGDHPQQFLVWHRIRNHGQRPGRR